MARKLSSIFLILAHLAILPGCQSFTYFGKSTPAPENDGTRQRNDTPIYSTASAQETIVQSPAKPLEPQPTIELIQKRKPLEGSTGIVTLELEGDKSANAQPAPLPQLVNDKTEYEPIVLALQRMLEGRHQDAIKQLSAYDGDKQELFLRLLPILSTLVKKRIEDLSTQEVAVLTKQIDGLKDNLRPRSELIVSRMCYCKEVKGFARVLALPDTHAFLAGTPDRFGEQVQVYVELKNFASEPISDGLFMTKLACSLELRDAKQVVWSKRFDPNETTLRASSRLNDFYSRFGFYTPPLPAGTYQLTLNVSDETNAKNVRVASRTMEFRVTPVANQIAPR